MKDLRIGKKVEIRTYSIFVVLCLILSFVSFNDTAASDNFPLISLDNRTRDPPQYIVRIEQGVEPEQFQQGCITCSYVGGYEDNPYDGRKADALRAIFSFPNTDHSAIPNGQYLKGWVESTVFTNLNSLDYGYRVGVELNRNEMIVWAEVWKFCEGLPGTQCGGTSAKLLLGIGRVIRASPSDKIEVKMQWDSADVVGFYYRINGGSYVRFAEYRRPPEAQSKFNLGTKWNFNIRMSKYFQFSLESPSNINTGGWNMLIEYPYYLNSGTWSLVSKARAVHGGSSWLDAVWRWGCDNYIRVNAQYAKNSNIGKYKIKFFYTTTTLPDNTLLWD